MFLAKKPLKKILVIFIMPLSKEKMREYSRKYREANKTYYEKYMIEWRKSNVERSRQYVKKQYDYNKQAKLLRNISIA